MSRADLWNSRYRNKTEALPQLPDYITRRLGLLPVGRTLDLACGEGAGSLCLASAGHDVLAVDFAIEGLNRLQRFAAELNLEIETLSLDLEFPDLLIGLGYFNNIVILRYMPNQELLERLTALMKPGAHLLIITFNPEYHRQTGFPEHFCLMPGELKDKLAKLTLINYDNGQLQGDIFDSYLFASESTPV